MKKYLLIFAIALLFASCAENITAPALTGTKWKLTEWPGQTVPAVAEATLAFNADSNVAGKSFCNGYGGSYVLNGDQIKFGPLFGTKMYCEAVGDAETKFLAAMDLVTAVAIKEEKLHLMQGDKTLLIFTKE